MKALFVIPARGGSKGIPHKNIKLLGGKPLIGYSVDVARQFADKNKFMLVGEYQASAGSQIRLNAMNVPRGSVVVTAGGVVLTENSDYTVDYAMGIVTITNQSIIDSGQNISVTLENQALI